MKKAIACLASRYKDSTPGGSAALCARLRLFALKPIWTLGLQQIHHYTRGSAPLSNRDKSLLLHFSRWTRSAFAIHPAAVCTSVASDRALTPRFAGLRPYASLLSSSLHSLAAIRDWAERPTHENGGSRLVVTLLDGGRPHRIGMPGAPLRFPILQASVGAHLSSFRLQAALAGASLLTSSIFGWTPTMKPHLPTRPGGRLWHDTRWRVSAPIVPVAGATSEPTGLLNAMPAVRHSQPERLLPCTACNLVAGNTTIMFA